MARKGILPRRKRGRTAVIPLPFIQKMEENGTSNLRISYGQGNDEQELRINNMRPHSTKSEILKIHKTSDPPDPNSSRSSSPSSEPLFHFSNIKLPILRPKLID